MNSSISSRVGQRLSALCAAVVLASTAFAQAPANDECAGALALTNGINGPYNNSTATTSTLTFPVGCSTSAPGRDLWFAYTPVASGTIVATTCGIGSFDSVVEVFDGSAGCGSLVSLGCNDDNCTTRSRVVFTGAAGTTYYIRVAAFGTGAGGAFSLEIQAPKVLTNRSLAFSGSTLPGGTFNANINHPSTEAGNIFAMLWSLPYNPPVTPVVPGFNVNGQIGVDPTNFLTGVTGVLAAGTTTPTSLSIPNNPSLFGYPLFGQSVDLDNATPDISFSDNRVGVKVGANVGKVVVSRATTTSFISGDNDVQNLDDGKVGLAQSQGLNPFTSLPTRPRSGEGFVEGYPGTNSSTSFDSDIDAESSRRVGRRTFNGAYQGIVTPSGNDISIIRINGAQNGGREYGILSYERSTGIARRVPGLSFTDATTTLLPAQNRFYIAVSRDGQWGCVNFLDSVTPAVNPPKAFAFRTDGLTAAVDITPPTMTSVDAFFDGAMHFTNDFLFVAGSQGWMWTSATNPGVLQPLALPNTTATNAPNLFVFSLSSRVSQDGSSFWIPIGSNATASRGENDIVRVTNVAGSPVAANHSQFAAATGIAEFGFSAFTPATTNNSAAGIKASVSPDGTKMAFITCTTTTSTFNGICVADGTANPPVRTVAGAVFYGDLVFLNNTTVLFFAGTTTAQALYSLDVPTGNITQLSTATDIRTRGQFWSLNKNWWYFIRSNSTGARHDIVAVNAATGALQSVTGTEFGTPGSVAQLRTGGIDTGTEALPARHFFIRRAPSGNLAYFLARVDVGATTFQDANVFRFDIENGGTATQLTANSVTGASTAVKNLESLTISADGNHLAWVEKVGTTTATVENVMHLNLTTSVVTQLSNGGATHANVTDSSVRFTGGATPTGVVWTAGSGSTTAPTTNTSVFWAPLGSTVATILMPTTTDTSTRLYQVVGTN